MHQKKKEEERARLQERMHSLNARVFESTKVLETKEYQQQELLNQAGKTFSKLLKNEKAKNVQSYSKVEEVRDKNLRRHELAMSR